MRKRRTPIFVFLLRDWDGDRLQGRPRSANIDFDIRSGTVYVETFLWDSKRLVDLMELGATVRLILRRDYESLNRAGHSSSYVSYTGRFSSFLRLDKSRIAITFSWHGRVRVY